MARGSAFFHLRAEIAREGGPGAWKEFLRRIDLLPKEQAQSIVVAMRQGGNEFKESFTRSFLSGASLHARTGQLKDSLQVRVKWPRSGPLMAKLSVIIGADKKGFYNMHQLGNARTGAGSRYLVPLSEKYAKTWAGKGSTIGDRFFLVQPKSGNAVLIDKQTDRPAFVLLDRAKKRMPFKDQWLKSVHKITEKTRVAWEKVLGNVFEGKT